MSENAALAREREREVTAVCAQDEAAVTGVSGRWDVTSCSVRGHTLVLRRGQALDHAHAAEVRTSSIDEQTELLEHGPLWSHFLPSRHAILHISKKPTQRQKVQSWLSALLLPSLCPACVSCLVRQTMVLPRCNLEKEI